MTEPVGDVAGFVLAGGRSSRMGTDKALLVRNGQTLLERVAREVCEAAGNITVIGDPSKYARFGFPVIGDERPGLGPLGGVVTALNSSARPWNLIVACDLPNADRTLLSWLLKTARAFTPEPECVVPVGPTGLEPLCAVYHQRAAPKARDALERKILKMRAVVAALDMRLVEVPEGGKLHNVNTPEDWTGE
jgi:molybdopterin-guanine dinucleotide biosynthesis protein A